MISGLACRNSGAAPARPRAAARRFGPLSAVLSAHMSSRATTAFSAPVDARARPQYTQCAAQDNVSPSMPSEVPTRRLLPCALMRRRDGRITSRGAAPRAPLTGDPAPLQPLQSCISPRKSVLPSRARPPLGSARLSVVAARFAPPWFCAFSAPHFAVTLVGKHEPALPLTSRAAAGHHSPPQARKYAGRLAAKRGVVT